MHSHYYSRPPVDLASRASLPRRSRGIPWPAVTTPPCKEPTWRPKPPTATRTAEAYPAYEHPQPRIGGPRTPGSADGALNPTAELPAKLLSGSEDLDVTAMSEAVRAELGIDEPLTKPAMASPSPGFTSLADDLKRARVSSLLPSVTCPSPFHPPSRTVTIAELQDVSVTRAAKRELTVLAQLARKLPPPSDQTSGVGRVANLFPKRTSSQNCRSSN